MKSHFVCALIWRWNNERGEIEFLVIDSVSIDHRTGRTSPKQTKFPGGCNRVSDEPIGVTLQREVLEETYLACLPINSMEIWKKQKSEHTKYGYLIDFDECRGKLRGEPLDDLGDNMSAPYWEPVSTLKYKLFDGHQEPFLKALEYFEGRGFT